MKLIIDTIVKTSGNRHVMETIEAKVVSLRKRRDRNGPDTSQIEVEALIPRHQRAAIVAPHSKKGETGYGWRNGQILRTTARLGEGDNFSTLAEFLQSPKARWCLGPGDVQQ